MAKRGSCISFFYFARDFSVLDTPLFYRVGFWDTLLDFCILHFAYYFSKHTLGERLAAYLAGRGVAWRPFFGAGAGEIKAHILSLSG